MNITRYDGTTITCEDEPFASGVDGAAHWTADGQFLVKLYHAPEDWRGPTLDAILNRFNAVRGEPYWEEVLCWPVSIVKSPRLGVIVPRAKGLKKLACFNMPKWLKYHPEDIGNFHGRMTIAVKMARAVRRMHFKGLCHSDLSDNNILANSSDGRTYVIDCDGLVVPGVARAVVLGTPGTMAPELVSRRVTDPSVESDMHSLAVLIYQTLMIRHPLLGRKVHDRDPDRDEQLRLGEKALFVEHPSDSSNRPERLDWPVSVLGSAVTKLMHRAFIDGLHNPSKRPQPSDWERDLLRLADTLITCLNPQCTLKSFPLPEQIQGPVRCPWCKTRLHGFNLPVLHWCGPVPGHVGVYREDGTRKVAWPDLTIHEWHIRPNTMPGPNVDRQPLANFARLQDSFGVFRWFLVNQNVPYLEAADPGLGWKRIRAKEAVELKSGRKLRFGPPGLARDAVVEIVKLE